MKARIKDFVVTYDGKQLLTFETTEDFRDLYDDLKDRDLEVSVKRYRRRRSLDANAYAWVLIGKLSEKLNLSVDEVYRHFIRETGVCQVIDINEKAVETIKHSWSLHGKGWITDVLDYGGHEDTKLVRLYYGSSVFNVKQMNRLIDNVIEACKQNGIEVMPPYELNALLERWGNREK